MRPIATIASDLDFDLLGLVRVRFWRLEMKIASSNICRMGIAAAATLALRPQAAHTDENGVSLWVPGLFGSLAAAPAVPGWSLGTVAYHITLAASGNVAAARQISIGQVPVTANVNLNANLNVRGRAPKKNPRQLPAGGSPNVSSLSGSEVTLSANVQEHGALVLELVGRGRLGSRR